MGSLGGDSGEEGNSGEVVMLGRRGGDQAFLGLCSSKDLHFPFPPLIQISISTPTLFLFILWTRNPAGKGVALTALLTSFQTCTSLDSGVVLEFESAQK